MEAIVSPLSSSNCTCFINALFICYLLKFPFFFLRQFREQANKLPQLSLFRRTKAARRNVYVYERERERERERESERGGEKSFIIELKNGECNFLSPSRAKRN